MPAIRTSFSAEDLLPEEIRGAIHRRIREIGGIGLLTLATAAALALASWSAQDPSLSHATAAPVRNLLGVPGAIAADLLMQLIGLASIALVLPIAVWGWRLLTHRSLDREWLRLVVWIVGMIAATAFASCLPATRAWPLPTGLGGVVGDALLRIPAWLAHAPLSGALRIAIAGATGIATLVVLAFSMGLGWRDRIQDETPDEPDDAASNPAEEGRSWISLGGIHHGILSLRARLARLFKRRRPAPPAPKIRIEPMPAGIDAVPVVTLYELEPAPGIKSSRVIGLSDDIARSMSALSARVAVVPGRNAIG